MGSKCSGGRRSFHAERASLLKGHSRTLAQVSGYPARIEPEPIHLSA
jgi:hypothetical protein